MSNIGQIIRYVKCKSYKMVNVNYYPAFGLTIYYGPEEPIFGLFDRVVIMEGIYSSICFTCNSTPNLLERENTAELIDTLIKRYFSKDYLHGLSFIPIQSKRGDEREGISVRKLIEERKGAELTTKELMEENNGMRVILIFEPLKGNIRMSFSDLEERGIYLPIHSWLDKTFDRSEKNYSNKCHKAKRITKLSFTDYARFNNNYQRFECWFYEKQDELNIFDGISSHEVQKQTFFSSLCTYIRDLYGRESSVDIFANKQEHGRKIGIKQTLKWDLPECEIILIKQLYNADCNRRFHKSGSSYMELQIKPRLIKSGFGDGKWTIDRLS